MARQPMHIAHEVNVGKKDVSFLTKDFDTSLLTEEKQAEFAEYFGTDAGAETKDAKVKEKTKRGGGAQTSPNA